MKRQREDSPYGLDRIFRFDKRVRNVSVIGHQGEALVSIDRPGLVSLEPRGVTTKVLFRANLGAVLADTEEQYHGKTKAVIIQREKVTVLLFTAADKTVFVSMEPDFPLSKTPRLKSLIGTLRLGS